MSGIISLTSKEIKYLIRGLNAVILTEKSRENWEVAREVESLKERLLDGETLEQK